MLGSEVSPAAALLSKLHSLKDFLTSISTPAYFSSIEFSYLLPKPDTPFEQSLFQSQTVWKSKIQPKAETSTVTSVHPPAIHVIFETNPFAQRWADGYYASALIDTSSADLK